MCEPLYDYGDMTGGMIGPTRKMPSCPRCGTDELYIGSVWWLSVNCYLCSWTSDEIKVWDGETISDAIDRVVEAVKERLHDNH